MSKQDIIEQLKNIKDQYLNDSKGEINSEAIIEAITDLIHDAGGNDGLDIHVDLEDDFYVHFEETDFSALEV